ncbi:hypothetical protein SASPL_140941 [Salvia splendens]|uniref:Spermidine/putrescine transport system substrate-binding protein n=1 Tax=Salvia splendens TaxID=180675 RepID=A0A8X8WR94_SALSN|nr:uncharacterized protein LOC121769514 [Salvia splendens]KAG6399460.1 hypothetical protein SASPL_140941 [Salvia splendens]
MVVLSLPSIPGLTYPDPNPTLRHRIRCNCNRPTNHSIKLPGASSGKGCSPGEDFLQHLSISSVFLIGVGISSLWAFPHSASARIPPSSSTAHEILAEDNMGKVESSGDFEDKDMNAAFERWKSKSYALSVPLRIVALEGSIPPVWIREFLKSQGKRVQFRTEFRRSVGDIFHELSNPMSKGKISPKSAVSADLVTLGDSWLNFSIGKGLIEPMKGIEEQHWFQDLSDKWKVYLRRSADGVLDSQGKIWAVPYRWGSIVIAYNNREFKRHKLAPVKDWSDLWRPELAGKISMVDSPREIIGAVLKNMGSSYNTTNIDSQVVGGKNAVLQQLNLLVKQVRLFDSQHYLKAFRAGDVWVAVGWSSDVLPVAKTMSNVSVMVPKSGASLWADLWAIPTTSRLATDQIGGRIRGASPLVQQWVEFCLQSERALPFKEEVVAGASPVSLKAPVEQPVERKKGRPKLETNLVGNVPPADILSKCELLEPLSEDALCDYEWLINSLPKPSHSLVTRLKHALSTLVPTFWSKMQSKAA